MLRFLYERVVEMRDPAYVAYRAAWFGRFQRHLFALEKLHATVRAIIVRDSLGLHRQRADDSRCRRCLRCGPFRSRAVLGGSTPRVAGCNTGPGCYKESSRRQAKCLVSQSDSALHMHTTVEEQGCKDIWKGAQQCWSVCIQCCSVTSRAAHHLHRLNQIKLAKRDYRLAQEPGGCPARRQAGGPCVFAACRPRRPCPCHAPGNLTFAEAAMRAQHSPCSKSSAALRLPDHDACCVLQVHEQNWPLPSAAPEPRQPRVTFISRPARFRCALRTRCCHVPCHAVPAAPHLHKPAARDTALQAAPAICPAILGRTFPRHRSAGCCLHHTGTNRSDEADRACLGEGSRYVMAIIMCLGLRCWLTPRTSSLQPGSGRVKKLPVPLPFQKS